ncbi:hypothetical protein JFL43_10430 [Viridibacillus sp. YIM B01967]|uniref:50S ribosomal protein L35 n=1 Tax=Viridibacillus soli TaxID=2798301 RepID=A0ABS1H761_9BACL|nr:hypothetical protein [Viridibacillus soli]MBK3495260.1 hypothetical protein [Viridibacillus soli]
MAMSKAKRRRKHVLRNLGKDVTTHRGEVTFSTHTRLTKTKKDKLQVQFHKHKKISYKFNFINTKSISREIIIPVEMLF